MKANIYYNRTYNYAGYDVSNRYWNAEGRIIRSQVPARIMPYTDKHERYTSPIIVTTKDINDCIAEYRTEAERYGQL